MTAQDERAAVVAAELDDELDVGDVIIWRAVAQEKPALRKALIQRIAQFEGEYSVRYVGGGVELRRLA